MAADPEHTSTDIVADRSGSVTVNLGTAAADGCGDRCCATERAATAGVRDAAWYHAARWARWLSWFSLVWMTGEGVLGLLAGTGANSISLIGWALGSVIEGLASVMIVWRFTGHRALSDTAEHQAQRVVASSFFLLVPYLVFKSVRDLVDGHHADETLLGIAVTAASLVVMPLLGWAKMRLSRALDSAATSGEGLQNLMCAGQAAAVLMGLAATATLGIDWVDPAIGLVIAGWSLYEGIGAWRGEECC